MKKEPKYKKGQKVLIDKIFVVEGSNSFMKQLPKPRQGLITEVESTPSLGPCYTISWIDDSLPEPKIKYWESDILSLLR